MVAELLLCHLVGDYLLQTHWMAVEKLRRWWPATAHGVTYGLPFVLVTRSVAALAVIIVTHVVLDRYRLARHVAWFKNQLAPRAYRFRPTATGYPTETPPFLAVWLMIVTDNVLHMLINVGAVRWLG